MTTIYLARHGQTVGNRDGFVLGRSDSPLTAEGIAVIEALADRLMDDPIRTIVASPLGRALATARIYSEKLSARVIVRDGIAELSCGSWEGTPRLTAVGDRPKLRSSWNDRPPDGESYLDGEERVRAVLHEIGDMSDLDTILVVGHASVNRVFLKLLLNLAPQTAMRVRCLHGLLYVIDGDGMIRRRWVTGPDEEGLSLEEEHL